MNEFAPTNHGTFSIDYDTECCPVSAVNILLVARTRKEGVNIARHIQRNDGIVCRVAELDQITFAVEARPHLIFLCCDGKLTAKTAPVLAGSILKEIPVIKLFNADMLTSRERAVLIEKTIYLYHKANTRTCQNRNADLWKELSLLMSTLTTIVSIMLVGLIIIQTASRFSFKSLMSPAKHSKISYFKSHSDQNSQ